MGKTLIVSVGGTLSPIIFSIKQYQPENIIFFTSLETEHQIEEIKRRIGGSHISKSDEIVSKSAENIKYCLQAILSKLPEILNRWKVKPEELIVDYTGGTKSMSSALVLGTINFTKYFSYVGAMDEKSRNKDGIGVVIDGHERMFFLNNPWDELAIEESKKIALLFNSGRYQEAGRISQSTSEKVSDRLKAFFSLLARFCEVYYDWDSFDYEKARHKLKRAIHDAEQMCILLPNEHSLVGFLNRNKKNLKFLNGLISGSEEEEPKKEKELGEEEKKNLELKIGEYRLLDLLANAKRRAEQEHRYDDALVRLYRALEKRVQLELKAYNLDTSNIKLELVPDKLKHELKLKYYNERKNRIETPLYPAYCLLKALEEEKELYNGIGHRFFEKYEELIAPIIDLRNKNIIIHGDNLADKDKFDTAWKNCLSFLQISEEKLPEFPPLEIKPICPDG